MPTGYTADILDGKIDNAQDFAKVCAHAFMWSMRDSSPGDLLATAPRTNSYEEDSLRASFTELAVWDAVSEEGRYALWSTYVLKTEAARDESKERCDKNLALLNKVRQEVLDIAVPETHQRFKEFMLEQIDSTIRFDATFNPKWYVTQPYAEWCDSQRPEILRIIEIRAKSLQEAEDRYLEGREWVRTLASLYNLEIKEN